MLYTRLAVCIDKSAAVVTRLAVHVMISDNVTNDLWRYVALMFFFE